MIGMLINLKISEETFVNVLIRCLLFHLVLIQKHLEMDLIVLVFFGMVHYRIYCIIDFHSLLFEDLKSTS